jgi:predicted phosphodiesterase
MKPSFSFLILICLSASLFGQEMAEKDSFLIKPYLQFGTKNSMHVLWETTSEASTTVEYGEALLQAEKPNLSEKVTLEEMRKLHEVKLDNLKVATKYVYRVRSTFPNGKEIVSPVYTFRTNVKDEDAYFFALVGDTQWNSRTPWAWGVIADLVWKDRPNFIIHAGDVVDTGTRKTDWTEQFFPAGHIAMSRFPMYTVLGNHEQDAQFYYDYMVNPAPEYYYTFKYGNAQFFMIDTNRDVTEGSEQYDWLEWELAKSDATWKFVVHHHPPYSTEENDHGDTYIGASTYQTHARNLTPLYDAYGVDFCLFGHTHVYERTWPIFNEAINLKDGVVYINSGGAGGGLEDFDPTRSWFTQELQTGHHYCTFAVYDKALQFKAIDHEGNMFDTFQMVKDEKKENGNSMLMPPAPHFEVEKLIFQDASKVKMTALGSMDEIRYTLDGSDPDKKSLLYSSEISVDKTATLKARVYSKEGKASRMVERKFTKMAPLAASKVKKPKEGLTYKYYEGEWNYLPDFDKLEVIKSGEMKSINEENVDHREEDFGLVLEGYVEFPTTDTYKLWLRSDDGSKMYIDGQLVVDHDGNHGAMWKYGTTILEKGYHKIRIEYFEGGGSQMLRAGYVSETMGKVPFGPMMLWH